MFHIKVVLRMFRSPLIVLLTASINPGEYSHDVKRADTEVRLRDYMEALRFWLALNNSNIAGIVFCENTGADLSSLKFFTAQLGVSKDVEWLSFNGNYRKPGLHYGYSELGIIDYAMRNSVLMRESRYFVKVTGRLRFPCISRLLTTLDEELLVALDCRRSYRTEGGPPIRVRTQLIFFATDFYEELFLDRRGEMVGLCTHIEEYLAYKLWPLRRQPGINLRWKLECNPVGVGAATQSAYHIGRNSLKSIIRGIGRRVVPTTWL